MSRWGHTLLEVTAVLAASGGAVVGAHGLVGKPSDRAPTTRAFLRPATDLLAPTTLPITSSAAGTFLGIRDEVMLDHLRSQPVVESRMNRGGSSISLRVSFASGARAAFKPLQTNPQTVPRKEVASYRLNRWFGLNVVPPATMRTLHHDDLVTLLAADSTWAKARIEKESIFDAEGFTRGEVSFWIPSIIDARLDSADQVKQWTEWMTIGNEVPPERVNLMTQLSRLLIFDMLQNNSDRFSGGNLLTSPDGKTLFWMDNTFGFQVDANGNEKCRTYIRKSQKFSRSFVARLRQLDFNELRAALAAEPGVLRDEEMKSVIQRKDWVVKYIDGLIAQHGESQVLVFP